MDDSLVDKYGPNYAPHSKLDNLAKLNNISMLGAESGLYEIELFKKKQYKRIENSTNRKVAMMANILRLTINDSLRISTKNITSSMTMRREIPVRTRIVDIQSSKPTIRTVSAESMDRSNWARKVSDLQKTIIPELKSLKTKEKFKPGLYYLVWADLSDSTKSSEKLTPEDFEKKVTKFISLTKESMPKQLKNSAYFVKDIGDASLFLFNNFLDILKWKQDLEKKM